MSIDQIATEALALSLKERAWLADKLLKSLDTEEFTQTDRLWSEEAKRRRDEVRSGQTLTIPGEEALAQVRRSLGRIGR